MKYKSLLIIILAIKLTSGNVLSQDYIPIVQENKTWNMIKTPFIDSGNNEFPYSYLGYSYKIIGDTLIAGITYKKLYQKDNWATTYYPDGTQWSENFSMPYKFIGCLREDITSKQVYYVQINPTHQIHCLLDDFPIGIELKLYDFDMEVGDTLYFDHTTEYAFISEGIDIITLDNGEQRKRYKFNEERYWVEGIGGYEPLQGLFSPYQYKAFEGGCDLNCLHDGEEYILGGKNSNCDSLSISMTHINEFEEQEALVLLYPNPIKGKINIITREEISKYHIIDSVGRTLRSNNNPRGTESLKTDIESLPKNTYMVFILLKNGKTSIHKILKK